MRPLRALAIYILVVFIGGALLAPWLYWLTQFFAHWFSEIADIPFNRFVNRSLLILALALLWPLLRGLGATSARDIGIVPPYGQSKRFFGGLLSGFVSLAVLAGIALGCHARVLISDITAHKIVGTIFSALATAAVVATLEEILFRGGIFGGLKRVLYWPFALAISSVIYALVHFLQRTEFHDAVAWNSGLIILPQMLRGFVNFQMLVPGILNLTLVGLLLGLAYQRTGTLYFSVGLHAGWIFWLKSYGAFTNAASGRSAWFWGTDKMIDGWLAFFVLALMLAFFKFVLPGEKRSPFTIPL